MQPTLALLQFTGTEGAGLTILTIAAGVAVLVLAILAILMPWYIYRTASSTDAMNKELRVMNAILKRLERDWRAEQEPHGG